ncbi:MAG TPA: sulfurtransferase TusA family protein [Planctomycetes bacterium]|nr:sulfurtransferase TusA family protein [Planctomycetota bacterium]
MDVQLDCKHLKCPMPIVEMAKAVKGMKGGEMLRVESTDPAFEMDVKAWAEMTGHELVSFEPGEVKVARIRVA